MIKSPQGRLLMREQEHKALVRYRKDLFAPEVPQACRPDTFLPLTFTLEEIQRQLQGVRIGKAAPARSAPAPVWRICASSVAPHL